MINSLENYYLSGVENNINFLMSILDDKKFRNGDISTNFIKDKFKKGYQSNLALNYDKEIKLSIFALVLHCYQIKEESLKKNKSYAVKILSLIHI